MKKLILALALVAVSTPVLAAEGGSSAKIGLGIDFAMPYLLDPVKARGAFNVGVDGRYMITDNMNVGLRFAFDVEGAHEIWLQPGFQYHWMPGETWNPFVRLDLPVTVKEVKDVGIAAGAGLAWNMGSSMGVENLSLRYDFDFGYLFDTGALYIEIFKIGVDYKF